VIEHCKFRAGREVGLVGLHMLGAANVVVQKCEFVGIVTGILAAAAVNAALEPTLNRLLDNIFIANTTNAANLAMWNYGTVKGNVFNAAGAGGGLLELAGGATGMNHVVKNCFSCTAAGFAAVATAHAADFWSANELQDAISYAEP
jgi:hypothetical protein